MSELYASLLMVGVTLSLGGVVTAAAVGQFGLTSSSASASGGLEQSSSGRLVSLVYASVAPGSGGCAATYDGAVEGDSLTLVLFDYGSSAFAPTALVDNSTVFASAYPVTPAGGMATYTVTLPSCAHASGQYLAVADNAGDEFEFET